MKKKSRSLFEETKIQMVMKIFSVSRNKAIEYIAGDELIEVTPKSIRLRKKILNTELRLKAEARLKKQD